MHRHNNVDSLNLLFYAFTTQINHILLHLAHLEEKKNKIIKYETFNIIAQLH